MRKHLLAGLLLLAASATPAWATNCVPFTYTLTNGQTADANQVMANFNTLLSCANNNLAHNGANSDITSISGLTTPLSVPQGGTGLGTLTAGNYVLGNGTSTPTFLPEFLPFPQGRLTLSTGRPVMIADVSGGTTVYYDSAVGNMVPVGATPTLLAITGNEVSMGLDSGTPHIASGSLYDVFAINNSGALAICAGPAWTNSTTRSSAVALNSGIWTNSGSLTHCWGGASGTTDYGTVAANAGTYLGTLYATANGQTSAQFKLAAGAAGTAPVIGLWNAYNRVRVQSESLDSSNGQTNGSATPRPLDNSNSNRVTVVDGLQQSRAVCSIVGSIVTNAAASGYNVGCDQDSALNTPQVFPQISQGATAVAMTVQSRESFQPLLGLHFYQGMEAAANANAVTIGSSSTQLDWDM